MATARRWGRGLFALLLALALLPVTLPVTARAADPLPVSSVTFSFTDNGVTAEGEGSGYVINGTALQIDQPGVYTVTGSCREGSITVEKEITDVTLILQDLTLSCSTAAPLSCNKETGVTIFTADDVTLSDKEDPDDENSEGAVIKIKSDASLTLAGSGTLNVSGDCKNGIKTGARSVVTVESGTVNITAANHGLSADNEVVINGGDVSIAAGNEGIKASPGEDDTDSLGNITINGGTVSITAADDGLHAEGDLTVNGGDVTVSAGDDALKAKGDLTINDGTVTVTDCLEGLEGATVTLNGGTGHITAADDGINASNSDLSGSAHSSLFSVAINGGSWYINAGGDGLDANGTVTVSGGVTELYGSTGIVEAALDYNTTCAFRGGTLLAVGMRGVPGPSSSGVSVVFGIRGFGRFGSSRSDSADSIALFAGDSLSIVDSRGTELYAATAVKSAEQVIFASDRLVPGEPYTLCVNGVAAVTCIADGLEFTDVAKNAWYADAVFWAMDKDITTGTSNTTFSPDDPCTRAQIVTFLWRAVESPAVSGDNPFTDVTEDAWYRSAVLWAVDEGVTAGTGDAVFSPDDPCTRAQAVTFLWRVAGSPAVSGDNPFTDVAEGAWYYDAVLWAVDKGITAGTGRTTFSPDDLCTRAQIVTFLWRDRTA